MDIRFTCPWCRAQLRAPSADAGTKHCCPKCSSLLVVPKESEQIDARPARNGYAVREESEGPGKADSHPVPEGPAGSLAQKVSVPPSSPKPGVPRPEAKFRIPLPPSERPKLPQWPMFSGTVTFLFYPGSLLRWIGLSAATLLVIAVIKAAIALASLPSTSRFADSAMAMSAAMAACSVLFVLAGLVTVSVHMLVILHDTAAGNDRVTNWPGLNFVDWVADALYVINGVVLCVPVGALIAWGLDQFQINGTAAVPASVFLLFPIVLLSMLDAESQVVPITTALLRTFLVVWRNWLLFYVEAAVLVAATAGLIGLILSRWPLEAIVPATILLIGALMLYFRLLGRLAWCCTEATRPAKEEQTDDGPG